MNRYTIKSNFYEVIVNIDYLQRNLIPQIKRGLKKGGVVVYENQTVDQLNNSQGEHVRRDYLLDRGELKELFKDLEILVYKETNDGKNAVWSLVDLVEQCVESLKGSRAGKPVVCPGEIIALQLLFQEGFGLMSSRLRDVNYPCKAMRGVETPA